MKIRISCHFSSSNILCNKYTPTFLHQKAVKVEMPNDIINSRNAFYIGQTSRSFDVRFIEHIGSGKELKLNVEETTGTASPVLYGSNIYFKIKI